MKTATVLTHHDRLARAIALQAVDVGCLSKCPPGLGISTIPNLWLYHTLSSVDRCELVC